MVLFLSSGVSARGEEGNGIFMNSDHADCNIFNAMYKTVNGQDHTFANMTTTVAS